MRRITIAAAAFVLIFTASAAAEDLGQIFGRVGQFVAAKNYPKALEELNWAKKEIEKMHVTQVRSFFPDSLSGYKGEKFESNSMLGFTNVERSYRNSSGNQVKVSMTGGSSGASAAGFGQLAALGSMAAMMGAQSEGNETFRIGGRTANLAAENGNPELTIFLNSGSILKLEMLNGSEKEELRQMAEAIKIDELDNYLRGANQ